MGFAVLAVSLLCAGLLGYLIFLKKQIRHVAAELKQSRHMLYNKQIRVQLLDRDLNELAKESNYNLDFQAECKRKAMRQEEAAKRAISDIAHDLRTPLTVVKGNLQLLDREGTLGEKERGYLRICESKTEELKSMVDAFFELSILESDTSKAELGAVDITSMLFQTGLEYESLIREHGLTPNLEIPEKTLLVQGSRPLLERMLGNLLGNILKYAADTFTIRLRKEGQDCVAEFCNPVAEPDTVDVAHIFDRAYKADASRHRQGAGLGLYIVKLLAQKQDAEVTAAMVQDALVITVKLPLFLPI